MSRAKDFAEDLQAISSNIENEVGRYVKLLRHETKAAKSSDSDSEKQTVTPSRQETKSQHSSADDDAGAVPAEPHVRTRSKPRPKVALAEQIVLENVTTRLHRGTNELLTEAALRQKLKKEKPDTRQEIVETALRDWFRKQGYSS